MSKDDTSVLRVKFSGKDFISLFVFLFVNFCLISPSLGQDQTNFTQFYINPYLLNSSYAGSDGQASVSLIYRKQWMTIDGAPTTASLTLQSPLTAGISAGVNVTNDSKGFFKNTGVLFSVAYHVPLRDRVFLRFGISAGGSWNTVDMQKLDGVNDPALSDALEKNASLTGNAGASFHYRSFSVGVALPALFSPVYVSEEAFTMKEIKPFQALIIHASNRFYFNHDKNIFEPYVVYRMNAGLPSQLEFAGIVHLNHLLWAGASYKEGFGISALGGIKLKNTLAIGGSYPMQQRGLDELNSPSFEVSINYLFGARKIGTPVYSFVNAVRTKERATPATRRQAVASKAPQAPQAQQKAVPATPSQSRKKQDLEKQRDAETTKRAREEQSNLSKDKDQQPVSAEKRPTEEERRELNEIVVDPGHPPAEITSAPRRKKVQRVASGPVNLPVEARHEIVKQGNDVNELEVSEYVVASVFKSADNAKRYSDGLRTLNFNSRYGYLTATDLWYVYIFKSDDAREAQAERARVARLFLLRDAWLLTVEP